MKSIIQTIRVILIATLVIFSMAFFNTAQAITLPNGASAATLLPSSTLPERASKNLVPAQSVNPKVLPPLSAPKQQQAPSLGAQAARIKFLLTKVVIQGNHVFTQDQLKVLYQDKLNKMITVEQLQGIVQDITNFYRNSGYILSRAVLPPQHVAKGIVYIQVIEGYIDHVKVIGTPRGATALVQAYGEHIVENRPAQLSVMEHYLLLANQIPGVQVKAVLEPSKTNLGASDLNLVADTKTVSAYVSYDNYGTRYIGPLQTSGGGELDSIFRAGDSTQINYVTTSRPQQLRFFQLSHSTPLGTQGMRLLVSGNQSLTRPAYVLIPLKIDGIANTFSTTLQYPLIRSRTHNLTVDGTLNYIDSSVTTLQVSLPIYTDHLRTGRAGLNYDFADDWYGTSSAAVHIEHGFERFGATPESEAESGLTSRFGASGNFTKVDTQLSRLQQFGASRYSAFFQIQGQYGFEPLLATEQFGFGGAQTGLGRGYDPAEIIGDRGLAGSVELRATVQPEKFYLSSAQLYVFYDQGVVWNAKNVIGQNKKSSAASTGVGSRFNFTAHLTGNLMITQPLTKQVDALALINDGRQPRLFFSITASV